MSTPSFRGVLLDIEGTTTPIRFVHDVLFPYARGHLASYLREHRGEADLVSAVQALETLHEEDVKAGLNPPPLPHRMTRPGHGERSPTEGEPADPLFEALLGYLRWLMDHDRKVGALKTIQGWIWEDGYRSGSLAGQVFPDVPLFLKTCRERGVEARIFSSGSVLAQTLLFSHSEAGDLTPFLSGYHDTTVGSKVQPESYARIASEWGLPPASIVFVSDVVAELDAAAASALQTRLSLRPGNVPQPANAHSSIHSLGELLSGPSHP